MDQTKQQILETYITSTINYLSTNPAKSGALTPLLVLLSNDLQKINMKFGQPTLVQQVKRAACLEAMIYSSE